MPTDNESIGGESTTARIYYCSNTQGKRITQDNGSMTETTTMKGLKYCLVPRGSPRTCLQEKGVPNGTTINVNVVERRYCSQGKNFVQNKNSTSAQSALVRQWRINPLATKSSKRCWLAHFGKEKLSAARARGPCDVGAGLRSSWELSTQSHLAAWRTRKG